MVRVLFDQTLEVYFLHSTAVYNNRPQLVSEYVMDTDPRSGHVKCRISNHH